MSESNILVDILLVRITIIGTLWIFWKIVETFLVQPALEKRRRALLVPVEKNITPWDKRTKALECGKCGCPFHKMNPDSGGGMCQSCWARSH